MTSSPAKLFQVQLTGGKKYLVSLDSKEIDSVLAVQDRAGRQVTWDNGSGSGLSALLMLDVLKHDTYLIYAASNNGAGKFTLTVREVQKEEEAKLIRIARANQLNDRVFALIQAGKAREALGLAREALTIRKDVQGEKHPHYAVSLNNLAGSYHGQGNYAKAEPLYRQALEIYKDVLGEKHHYYAQNLENLASLYNQTANFARAEHLYRQTLEIQGYGWAETACLCPMPRWLIIVQVTGNYAKGFTLLRLRQSSRRLLGKGTLIMPSPLITWLLYTLQKGSLPRQSPYCQALGIMKEGLGVKPSDCA